MKKQQPTRTEIKRIIRADLEAAMMRGLNEEFAKQFAKAVGSDEREVFLNERNRFAKLLGFKEITLAVAFEWAREYAPL